jgi:hypothetical protein
MYLLTIKYESKISHQEHVHIRLNNTIRLRDHTGDSGWGISFHLYKLAGSWNEVRV